METLNEVNELLNTKMCSPVIIYGIILIISLISIYFTRNRLQRYNTLKMENLYNLYTAQEFKFLIILSPTIGVTDKKTQLQLSIIF